MLVEEDPHEGEWEAREGRMKAHLEGGNIY